MSLFFRTELNTEVISIHKKRLLKQKDNTGADLGGVRGFGRSPEIGTADVKEIVKY